MILDARRTALENRMLAIWHMWEDDEPDYRRIRRRLSAALRAFPESAKLRCMYADALVVDVTNVAEADVTEAIDQLTEALKIDPQCFEAHESLGYIYDVYLDDYDNAIAQFRRAIAIHESRDSVLGLARSLAEAGHWLEALATLNNSIHRDSFRAIELKHEIEGGEWSPEEETAMPVEADDDE